MALSEFGLSFRGDMSGERTRALAQLGEDAGFEYGWVFDTHVLFQECFPTMMHILDYTERMKTGPLVANPVVRDPTLTASLMGSLNKLSGGRAELGFGRGDSSVRMIGKSPMPWYDFEDHVGLIKDLHQGEEIEHPETGDSVQLTWSDTELACWVAAYGPKMLEVAGKVGDGLVLQLSDPYLVEWFVDKMRAGAEKHGRDPDSITVMSCAPVWISDDMDECRERLRWFPALVGNHVADLVRKHHKEDQVPEQLTSFIEDRPGGSGGADEGYDYEEHTQVEAEHTGWVPDEIVERFCIAGTPEDHIAKLEELEERGVDHFNIYNTSGDEAQIIETYGKEILPEFIEGKDYSTAGAV